jgi:hypothetical protein
MVAQIRVTEIDKEYTIKKELYNMISLHTLHFILLTRALPVVIKRKCSRFRECNT